MAKSDRYDVRKYSYRECVKRRKTRIVFSLIISRGKDARLDRGFRLPVSFVDSRFPVFDFRANFRVRSLEDAIRMRRTREIERENGGNVASRGGGGDSTRRRKSNRKGIKGDGVFFGQ